MKNTKLEPYKAPQCEVVPILPEGVVCNSLDPATTEAFDETDFIF